MSAGKATWDAARERIMQLLSAEEPTLRDNEALRAKALIPQADVRYVIVLNVLLTIITGGNEVTCFDW